MPAPSPYRVAVGLLLRFYVSGRPVQSEEESSPFMENLCWALERLSLAERDRDPSEEAVFILEEIESMSHARQKPFSQLLEGLAESCGELWPSCLEECLRAIRSPDDLVTIISLLQELKSPPIQLPQADGTTVRPTHLEPDSFFGIYLRQLVLEFHRVVFEGLSTLVDDMQAWVAGDEDDDEDEQGEKDAEDAYIRRAGVCGGSARMAQEYLQNRVLDLEYDAGVRSYEETEQEVSALLRSHSELPRGHFLRYLNSTQHKEFTGALDAVHRYFDYAIQRGGPNALGKSSTRKVAQYAVLNLAALHFRFGHTDLALTAVRETIRIAQQNGDHTCVAFALSWMHQLLAKSGDPQAEEVLYRCIARAGEQRLRHLRSMAALSLASFEAMGGAGFQQQTLSMDGREAGACTSTRPRRIWEALRLSVPFEPPIAPKAPTAPGQQTANVTAGSLAAALQSRDSFPLTLQESFQLAARRCLVAAGAWEMLGHRELMVGQARKLLYCYGQEATSVDTTLALIKTALAGLRGPVQGLDGHSEGQAPSAGCVYSRALEELCALRERFPVPIANLWSHTTALLLHEWALNRGEVQRAETLCLLLRGLSPADSVYGVEAHVEARLQWTRGLLAGGQVTECLKATQELADFCESKGLPWHYARCLLQLAATHLQACPFDPTSALPPLLRCISFCESFDMDVLHAVAFLQLAQVRLRLRSVGKARALLKAALPTLLEHAALNTQGEAWLTLAKCYLLEVSEREEGKRAGSADEGEARTLLEYVGGSLGYTATLLCRAQAAFLQSQDVTNLQEVYYLRSRLHDRLASLPSAVLSAQRTSSAEQLDLRDRAARAFHRCSAFLAKARLREDRAQLGLLQDLEALRAVTSTDVQDFQALALGESQ